MTRYALEVNDLSVAIASRRGTVRAVQHVSFAVPHGEFFGVVGESGCGKTTLLRAISGTLGPTAQVTSGMVRLGEQVGARGHRARIGLVMQDPVSALNPVMRVGDQVAETHRALAGSTRRDAQLEAIRLMDRVGIPDPSRRYGAYPHELSGGLNQRLLIAIALAGRPTVLLCDEPTTALDVTVQDQILRLLVEIGEDDGLSVVYVTHDLAVVAETCHSVAVMYAGQIVEMGPVHEVFATPGHPYLLGLLSSVPSIEPARETLAAIPGSPPDLASPLDGCPFEPRCRYAIDDCATGDFPLLTVREGRSSACIRHDLLLS